jgi:3-hydroxyisobutyrate dehydrogenase-like beta-hydroxyacid dehydrogenase
MADKQRIGFIGAGLMGHGMAKNIVEKGYPLTVLGHRNRQPIDDLVGRGAREAKSPKDLAQQSDIVILCVTGSPQVEELVFKKDGLLEGLRSGMIVADATTAEPTSTLKVAAAVTEAGARFADIPLIRTPKEAEAGTLGVMVGSDAALLAELKPVLETFANAIFHAGPLGAGHKLKLINNYIALAAAAAAAEGIATAKKAGVDLKALSEIVLSGGANSVMFQRLSKYFLDGDDSHAIFALSNCAKDLRYYTHMAEATPVVGFIAEAVHQTFQMANTRGFGDKYLPHIIDAIEEANGGKR